MQVVDLSDKTKTLTSNFAQSEDLHLAQPSKKNEELLTTFYLHGLLHVYVPNLHT